jgi:hypothetical protein
VGRFDREQNREALAESLGGATDELRATVEGKLREIVETAEARAHEIEDRALEQAQEIEQDADRRAREQFAGTADRAAHMLAAIDAFEREAVAAIDRLRTRGEALASQLDEALGAEQAAAPEVAPVLEQAQPRAPAKALTDEPPVADDPREAVRSRILDLFLAGRPRADAERVLGEFGDGTSYVEIVDEIYESQPERQQGSRRRRGGRRRSRPGS